MKVVIRADASIEIGSGHIARCLNLAEEIRRRGGHVCFVSKEQAGNLVGRIRQAGFQVTEISTSSEMADANRTIEVIGDSRPDWLVVDHYGLGRAWEASLRRHVRRMLVIDDIARAHDCDALLDQNWFGDQTDRRYMGLLPGACRQLLGPTYALLGSEYAPLRSLARLRENPPRRLLVSFGGTDPTNETAKALSALCEPQFSNVEVDLVVRPMDRLSVEVVSAAALRPNLTVHSGLRSLAALMIRADYSLGAAGVTTWERLCLGLPSAVVAVAENQIAIARSLAEAGYVHWIGSASETTAADYVAALSQPPRELTALPVLVDGLGASRCTEYMLAA